MGRFFGQEIKKTPVKSGNTSVTLPSGSFLKLGGQGFTLLQNLLCDFTVSGLGGLEAGSVIPQDGIMFLFVVRDGNTNYLTFSSTSQSSFSSSSFVGFVQINGGGIYDVYPFDTASPNSERTQYSPVYQNFTIRADEFFYHREGNLLKVRGTLNGLTSSANRATMSLPNVGGQLLINFSELETNRNTEEGSNIGSYVRSSTSTSNQGGLMLANIIYADPENVNFGFPIFGDANGASGLQGQPANVFVDLSDDPINVVFEVPIVGWDKNLQRLLG